MSHTVTVELPDSIFETITEAAKINGKTPEELIVENISPFTSREERRRAPFPIAVQR